MVLQNYVILQPGTPARMHFRDHDLAAQTITDPVTRKSKEINTLRFAVDELDGKPVHATYSITSEKHANDFAPFLAQRKYLQYDFIVLVTGAGWSREFSVRTVAR